MEECPFKQEAMGFIKVQHEHKVHIETLEEALKEHLKQHDRFYWVVITAIVADIVSRIIK